MVSVEEYKEALISMRKAEKALEKCMQEVCTHEEVEYGEYGNAGDGDLHYYVKCKICGKYASYYQGYYYITPLGKDYEEYLALLNCGRKK